MGRGKSTRVEVARPIVPNPDKNLNLSDVDLELLGQLRPDLQRKLEKIKDLQAQRLRLEAQAEGGFRSRDPLYFITKVLGWRPTQTALNYGITSPITDDQLKVLHSIRDNKNTAVPAGHGVGKTNILGAAVLWFLYGGENRIVITTAPTWELVEAQLWREIRQTWNNARIPLSGRLLTTQLDIGDRWFAKGLSTDDETKFRGFHAPGGVLIVFDEATGIREELWDAAQSMVIGPEDRMVAIGNPTNPSSRFKAACENPRWNVVRIDCRTHPNVVHRNPNIIPGAVTHEWVVDRIEEYGGEDSPLFHARVAGLWPTQSQDSLISMVWVDEAQKYEIRKKAREAVLPPTPGVELYVPKRRAAALGIDIAGPGADLCCCWDIEDEVFKLLWWTVHRDLMETAGRIVRTIRDGEGKYAACAIDDTGIGNGVSSRVLEVQRWAKDGRALTQDGALINCAIIRVNFGERPRDEIRFRKRKDELWWQFRESLMAGRRGLPSDQQIANLSPALPRGNSYVTQLLTPIYEQDSAGKIHVYDKRPDGITSGKSEKHKRLAAMPTKSPDLAHSLILAEEAYRSIRAELLAPPPRTIQEHHRANFADKIREAMGMGKKKAEENTTPEWYKYL